MKRYNVFDLYVIKIPTIDGHQSFICKRSGSSFMEILSNEKIASKNNYQVTPLSDYYKESNELIVKQIMIDKKEVLGKYLEINDNSKQQEYNSPEAIAFLNDAVTRFFASDGWWSSLCFSRSNELNKIYLPCHLNDNVWLAKMLIKSEKLPLNLHQVLEYVQSSTFFAEKKHEYAQGIVAWQIDWITSGGENWITDEQFENDFIFYSPECDKGVRSGVLKTLKAIGMDEAEIEEGIEKNASKWRDKMMKMAFNNIYSPLFYDYNPNITDDFKEADQEETIEPLPEVDPLLEQNWLAIRKYEYYQEHKKSVDRFGEVEPEMGMTKDQLEIVNATLTRLHNERMRQIIDYRRNAREHRQNRYLKM